MECPAEGIKEAPENEEPVAVFLLKMTGHSANLTRVLEYSVIHSFKDQLHNERGGELHEFVLDSMEAHSFAKIALINLMKQGTLTKN